MAEIHYNEEPEAEVEFSKEAIVLVSHPLRREEQRAYNAFQRDSYAARVVFLEDGSRVVVALPTGARNFSEEAWVADVVDFANDLVCLGEESGVMPERPERR